MFLRKDISAIRLSSFLFGALRAKGTLPVLKAFESVTNTVTITFTEEKES